MHGGDPLADRVISEFGGELPENSIPSDAMEAVNPPEAEQPEGGPGA